LISAFDNKEETWMKKPKTTENLMKKAKWVLYSGVAI
jgi:hypothetical protein